MYSLKQLMNASLVVGKFTPDIFLASESKRNKSYFYLVVNNKIEAHIYRRKNQWYIWYCKKAYRTTVKSFTDACLQLEEEVMNCVEQ